MAIEKIKILGAIQPIWPVFEVNGLDWHCCLASSSKTAPRILIFSIVIGADYSYEVKLVTYQFEINQHLSNIYTKRGPTVSLKFDL